VSVPLQVWLESNPQHSRFLHTETVQTDQLYYSAAEYRRGCADEPWGRGCVQSGESAHEDRSRHRTREIEI